MHRDAYEIVAVLPIAADAARSRQQSPTVPIAPLIRQEIRSIDALVVDHGRRRNAEKISDVAAIDIVLDCDSENPAQRGRKIRVKVGMGKHGGADNYFAAGVDFAVCGLLRGKKRQPLRFELLLPFGQFGDLVVEGFARAWHG
jgi:hypothetical protein